MKKTLFLLIIVILVLFICFLIFSSAKSEKLKLKCSVLINQKDEESYYKYIEYYDNNVFKEKYVYNFKNYKKGAISYLKSKFQAFYLSQKKDDSLKFEINESKDNISFIFVLNANLIKGDKPDMYGLEFKNINVDSLEKTLVGGGYKCTKY